MSKFFRMFGVRRGWLKIVASTLPSKLLFPRFFVETKSFSRSSYVTHELASFLSRDAVKSLLFEAPLISGQLETRVVRPRISANSTVDDLCADISNSWKTTWMPRD